MNAKRYPGLLILLVGAVAAGVFLGTQSAAGPLPQGSSSATRENAYRENNLGVALLEQFKYKEGVEAFKRALQLEPKLTLAHINLSIALFNVPDLPGAEREARTSLNFAPRAPQPYYILGLITKTTRPDQAVAAFQKVLEIDPNDVGTNINLGQILAQQRKYPEAIAAFRKAIAAEPYNATALYNLGQALMRSNQRDEGLAVTQRFKELRERGSSTSIGNNYLEQGRYAEAVASTGAEPDLVDKRIPDVVFKDVTASALPSGSPWPFTDPLLEQASGAVVLFDYDSDGDLDLLEVSSTAQRLYRNDAGKFSDVTAQSGDLAKNASGVGTGAVAGDFDNDGKVDLFVLRYRASGLYHNDGSGHFTDVTAKAKLPDYPYLSKSAAFVDYDHDGDLDILIGGGSQVAELLKSGKSLPQGSASPAAPGLLLRNNGDGTFSDYTTAAKLATPATARAVVPTDFDNRRDIDVMIASTEGVGLWRNMRDGTFKDVAREVGLGAEELKASSSVAIGDLNKDGFIDFYFGHGAQAGYFALSDGREHFELKRGPGGPDAAEYDNASQLIDYDNDGLLDLVTAVTGSSADGPVELRIWRNTGDGWVDLSDKTTRGVSTRVGPVHPPLSGTRLLAAGDFDGDGDTDLIFGIPGGGLRLARNDGGNRNRAVRVQLAGKVSNRGGVGVKVELRAGSLQQKLETYAASPAPAPADILFGLGPRERADAIRLIWPSGVVQSETEFGKAAVSTNLATVSVTELDRKPSSCPYLYAWNGKRFEFITDFMGGGEMGYLEEPGRHNSPDPVEYVRIRADQLQARAGRYELRVTNELEEALFADRFQLIAVDHPQGVEVYPNEGMTDPPRPFKLYATHDAHPPLSAVDDHGHDVLARIAHMDRQYPDDFQRDRIRGYAEEHTLTMDLGETPTRITGTGLPGTAGVARVPGNFNSTDSVATEGGRAARGPSKGSHASHRHPAGEQMVLLLTGWTDYAWSSDNVAAAQAGKQMTLPALQVKDPTGQWRTVIADIGIPVGRPQTVTVDLSGKFLSSNREVRIVTNMRILWDQILVDTSADQTPLRITRLDTFAAALHWRGFSREVTPDGQEPYGYDYEQISAMSPWKVMPGRYTREGDVSELLQRSDDMFVISRPGDEISLSFDARRLPPVRASWSRTFLLFSDGFSKEMDINSASPDQVSPLPFHGMTKYPYEHPEAYPMTAARRAYLEKYNTRLVTTEIPSLDAVLTMGGSDLRGRPESGKTGAPTERPSYNFLRPASDPRR
jgi:tetratricopeptide (TPR) repeat protein